MFRLFLLFLGFVLFPQLSLAQSWDVSPDKDYHNGVVVIQGGGLQGSGTVVKFIEDAGENYIGLILTASHCVKGKDTLFDVILEVTKRRMKQIDAYYADLQKGYNAYSFTPNMALQYEDFSDIQNRNVNYDSFLKY